MNGTLWNIALACLFSSSFVLAFRPCLPSLSRTSRAAGTVRVCVGKSCDNDCRKTRRGPVHMRTLISLELNPNGEDGDNSPAEAIGGDLASALARLDKKWEMARSDNGGKKIGNWNVLDLKGDDDVSPEVVYLLEPSSGAIPSCIILFLGGAVLGQFPHIAYSAFLERVSVKMNASVLAIPYEVNLDHFSIAQRAVSRIKNAVIECEDSRGYPAELPKYAIGHSLGCKLHGIGIAATGIGNELAGVGFVSYNNFGFAQTINMARSFANEMQVGKGFSTGSSLPFDALFNLAGMAVSAVGLEFTPTPSEMDRIVTSKLGGDVLKKIRMFQFEDDNLDSTKQFTKCLEKWSNVPEISYLPGTHLTPVFLKLGLEDLPDEAKNFASQATGGFQSASFGNEKVLDLLVDEVTDWMMGGNANGRRETRKQIAGTS